jgi:prepilin-type N-terminal cleavage/methylation domain-containing protein
MTLVEVMVVVAIIAILVAGAVVVFSRNTAKADYDKLVARLTQDVQWAKYDAISSKEDRAIIFNTKIQYEVDSVQPGTDTNYALLRRQDISGDVEVTNVVIGALTAAGNSPSTTFNVAEIRFTAVGDVELKGAGLSPCPGTSAVCTSRCACSGTIFLRSVNDRYKHRIVIYQSTGYSQLLEGW